MKVLYWKASVLLQYRVAKFCRIFFIKFDFFTQSLFFSLKIKHYSISFLQNKTVTLCPPIKCWQKDLNKVVNPVSLKTQINSPAAAALFFSLALLCREVVTFIPSFVGCCPKQCRIQSGHEFMEENDLCVAFTPTLCCRRAYSHFPL